MGTRCVSCIDYICQTYSTVPVTHLAVVSGLTYSNILLTNRMTQFCGETKNSIVSTAEVPQFCHYTHTRHNVASWRRCWHYCFVLRKSWVWFLTTIISIINKIYSVFMSSSRQNLGQFLNIRYVTTSFLNILPILSFTIRSCFVFGRSQFQFSGRRPSILADASRDFLQSLQENPGILP